MRMKHIVDTQDTTSVVFYAISLQGKETKILSLYHFVFHKTPFSTKIKWNDFQALLVHMTLIWLSLGSCKSTVFFFLLSLNKGCNRHITNE